MPSAEVPADLLDALRAAYEEAHRERFVYVLQHWIGRLRKHGLAGSAEAAADLAKKLAPPAAKAPDRAEWLRIAGEIGGDRGANAAMSLVQDALIQIMEDDRKRKL